MIDAWRFTSRWHTSLSNVLHGGVALMLRPHAFYAIWYDEVPWLLCHIGGSSLLKKLQKTEPSVCVGAWMAKCVNAAQCCG